MDQKKFESILSLIVSKVIDLIIENYNVDELTASRKLYASTLYSVLENEETKIWHFSPLTLFNMYDEEVKTGKITFPEE